MRDIALEETIYMNFTTRAFATGIPTSLLGTPALSVLESNNATPITSGVSVQVDRASVTGLNQATIVATAANGYEAGKSYGVYISTGTVGGVSVIGEVVGQFTVQAAASFTRLGAPAGASVSADVAAVKVDTAAVKVKTDFLPSATAGAAGGVFIAGTNAATTITTGLTTTFTGNLTGSVGSVTGAVGSVTGAVGSVTGLTASNLDAAITSRMATYTQPTGFLATTFPTGTVANTTNITAGTITTATNLTINNDKAGYSLAQAFPTNFADLSITLTTGLVNITQTAADKAWSTGSRLLTAGTNIVLSKGVGVIGFNDLASTDIVSGGAITTSGGVASADIKRVNAITVDGVGTAADPWGPV
mgnify:CR=1 FL=1